jgi:hypothetical protein
MSSPRRAKTGALTRQDVFAILGSLGALVTIITAVMLYFGWRRSDVQAREMGIDVTLFGFSAQDYVLRSISSLYLPLLAVFGLALAWLWLHTKVAGMLRRLATAPPEARKRAARRSRLVAVMATALAAGCVLFALATGLSSPPWPVGPIAEALVDRQWTVPAALVLATLTATYAFWARRRLTERDDAESPPWQVALTGAIVVSTVGLGGFWMLEEYASAVGRRYALRIAADVDNLSRASVISPTPLGIRADGVREELVKESGSTYYRTIGLRLLARSGGKVLLLPDNWTPSVGIVVVVADRDDLIWQFSR